MGKLSMDLYLKHLTKRYKAANRNEKGEILKELCESSGFHRKHAIRLLNMSPKKQKRKIKTGRPKTYSDSVYLEALKRIWLLTDQLCGKRLKMALPIWLPFYGETYSVLEQKVYDGLLSMSASTVSDPGTTSCRVSMRGVI